MNDRLPIQDDRISAYLDNEMAIEERADFERLLAERPDYRAALEELSAVSQSVRGLPPETLPDDFAQRVLRQAERAMLVTPAAGATDDTIDDTQVMLKEAPTESHRRPIFWPIAAVAAGLLAMLVLPAIWGPRQVAVKPATEAAPASTAAEDVAAVAEEVAEMEEKDADSSELNADTEFGPSGSLPPAPAAAARAGESEMLEESETASERGLSPEYRGERAKVAEGISSEGISSERYSALKDRRDSAAGPLNNLRRSAGRDALESLTITEPFDAIADVEVKDPETANVFFETLLSNSIALDETARATMSAANRLRSKQKGDALDDGLAQVAADEKASALAKKETDNEEMALDLPTMAWQLEKQPQVVLVEAPPEQLTRVIDDLKSQSITVNFFGGDQLKRQLAASAMADSPVDQQQPEARSLPTRQQLETKHSADGVAAGRAVQLPWSQTQQDFITAQRNNVEQIQLGQTAGTQVDNITSQAWFERLRRQRPQQQNVRILFNLAPQAPQPAEEPTAEEPGAAE